METARERNWTAHLVISSEHAGLKPFFKALEDEMYRVFARVDDARDAGAYVQWLVLASDQWYQNNRGKHSVK